MLVYRHRKLRDTRLFFQAIQRSIQSYRFINNNIAMNIEEIYKQKQSLIEKVMSRAMSKLFDDIDADDDFSLSTEEIIDLCEELFITWRKGGIRK